MKYEKMVVKDNALINASYTLSLVEQRLILLAISIANKKGLSYGDPITIETHEYIEAFGAHKNSTYQALRAAQKNLKRRFFSYQKKTEKGNIEHVESCWVQKFSYVGEESLIRIWFSIDVAPLLSELQKCFTSYDLDKIKELTSIYAIRMYEILCSWRNNGGKTPIIELNELRKKLGVETNQYPRMGNFKERVLDVAVEQINKHTDITVSYTQHKNGKVITGFSFTFKSKIKDVKKIDNQRDNNTLDLFAKMSDKQIGLFSLKLSEYQNFIDQYSKPGESLKDFQERIKLMLLDNEQQEDIVPYLKKLGLMG